MTDDKTQIVADQIDSLKGVESLAETPFSGLFHEARTTTRDKPGTNGYRGVVVQVRVRGGKIETSDPVKTRQGEHLRGTDAWDGKVSLPVRSFMEVRTARQEIIRQLRDLKRNYAAKAR